MLLVGESEIRLKRFGFWITAQLKESGIQVPLTKNPESRTFNPESLAKIQNPRLSWIPLHRARGEGGGKSHMKGPGMLVEIWNETPKGDQSGRGPTFFDP